MNRSIEMRLKRLEALSAPVEAPRKVHLVAAKTDRERDPAVADLVAAGAADPGDSFIFLVPAKPDPTSSMHDNYWWDEAAGRWEPKDGRADIDSSPTRYAALARLPACGR